MDIAQTHSIGGSTVSRHEIRSIVPGLAVFLAAAILLVGCGPDSAGVLREIRTIDHQQRSADLLTSLGAFGREADLADRVKRYTEDVVTQAYLTAADDEERSSVLHIAAENEDGTGRYIPLLVYVMVAERDPELRLEAARPFAKLRRVSSAINRSAIVLLLGQLAEGMEYQYQREMALYCMEEFLRNACSFSIPGGERREGDMLLGPSDRVKWRVVRSDPQVVWKWWKAEGAAQAKSGKFGS
jgi:hypothetical protein